MVGKKGFSPKVYMYYKIDGDKATRERKTCSRCGKGALCLNTKIDIPAENVV